MKIILNFAILGLTTLMIGACSSKAKNEEAPASAATEKPMEKAAESKASTKAAKVEGVITCKVAGDERTIEVVKEGSGCKVVYTKMGNAQDVATAANDMSYCEEKAQKIKSNLENATFECK